MTVTEFFFHWVLIWFITMFFILPIGIRISEDSQGTTYPNNIRISIKILINTVLSFIITFAMHFILKKFFF